MPAATFALGCRSCRARTDAPGAASAFDCTACGARNFAFCCERCGGANLIAGPGGRTPAAWSCIWCLKQNMTGALTRGRKKRATIEQAWTARQAHGLTGDPDARLLGGFTFLGGSGDCPPANTICSIAAATGGVLIVAEVGANGSSLLPYDELLQIEVGGHGLVTSGGAFAGGGRGITGALTGMAIASMLNTATRKTAIDSYIRFTSRTTEMLLSHWKYPPETVRSSLSTMFVRHLAARETPTVIPALVQAPELPPPGPVDELERLTRLHAAGTLTDNEFEVARSRHIQALREGTA